MVAVITGDIIESRSVQTPDVWLKPLRAILQRYGNSLAEWEIYRGDSFQLEVSPEQALSAALTIKSVIKKIKETKLDIRLSIGIGEKEYTAEQVGQSSGTAFIYSGDLLETLKEKKQKIGLKSPWNDFNSEWKMLLKLAEVILDSWTGNTAETAELMLSTPGITQTEIAEKLGIAQSSVNDRIKRGAVYEILELNTYYKNRIKQIISKQAATP